MRGRGALTLFRVKGIRIAADPSWFLVLFLILIWLSGFYETVTGASEGSIEPYILAVLSALAFFGSIVLHELGHAIVALRNGIGIKEITLWLFGGLAHMERDTDSAGVEFRVAAAGPAVTLAIALVATAGGILLAGSEQGFLDAMVVSDDADVSGALAVVAWLASLNVIILLFNLIPAFPLDGGRIVRAALWRLTGDRHRATRFAAIMGQAFSYLLIALGLFAVLAGGSIVTGLWLAIVGFMLGSAARGTVRRTELETRIGKLSVADIMDSEPIAISADATVERALDEFFLRYRWPWFPVTDATQRFLGLVERTAADAVPDHARETRQVSELLEADPATLAQVRDDATLDSLLGNEALRRFGGLAAVDAEGRLRGVITAEQIGRALRDATAEPPPAA